MKQDAPKKPTVKFSSEMSDDEKQQLLIEAEHNYQRAQDEHVRNVALEMTQAKELEVQHAKDGLKNAIMEIVQNKVNDDEEDDVKRNPLPNSLITKMHYDRIVKTKNLVLLNERRRVKRLVKKKINQLRRRRNV